MDITSLNNVIPNDEGLQALKHFFNQCTVKEPCSETKLCLAKLVITLNYSSFDVNYYKQTKKRCSHWYQNGSQPHQSLRMFYQTAIFY